MFHKCSEKCLCAGGGQQGGKETVLYCYGEVSLDEKDFFQTDLNTHITSC